MAIRIAATALVLPLVILAILLAVPGLDQPWGTYSFHFYVVSAASLMSAFICLALIVSARTMRETRIMFLALSFFALAMFFSIHGLTTPGFLFNQPYAALERSPWLSTIAAGLFAALSVITIPAITDHNKLRGPQAVFAVCAGAITSYFLISMAFPDWLRGFPTQEEWFQHLLTAVTCGLLSFAAWRYFQSYLFAQLPSQLALSVGLIFLAEAQLSLDFGEFWHYSWWIYHGLFLMSFSTVLLGWTWEMLRAHDGRAIADGLAMRDALTQMNRGRPSELARLADQIENHDLETFRHIDRVAAFAYAIGSDLGFNSARLRELVLSAQMHDVGKIGLPPYILVKPGPLTEAEWTQVKQHPTKGWDILHRFRNLQSVANIVRGHHERFDGAGYPDGLAGEQIPLETRIISVADTFDALTTARPYSAAMTIAAAREELQRVAGSQLDPSIVRIMHKLMDNGTLVTRQNPPVTLDDEAQHKYAV